MVQMSGRRPTLAIRLLGLAGVIAFADSRPNAIFDFPVEIRKRNYVRLSTEKCDECVTLEDFYAGNSMAFVLFFERALMGGNNYKEAIVRGWMKTCENLRYSRIACGLVDMLSDKPYAEKYIDPKTAPGHINVLNGEPVSAKKEQVNALLAKPGDPDLMLAHVTDLFASAGTRGDLLLSTVVTNKESLQRLLKQHRVVVVAFTGEERKLSDAFRAGVQGAVVERGMDTRVRTEPPGRGGKGKDKPKEKWRIAFAAVQGKGLAAHFKAESNSIAVFVDGELQPGAKTMNSDAKPGDKTMIEAVEEVTYKIGVQKAEATEGEAEAKAGRQGKGDAEL